MTKPDASIARPPLARIVWPTMAQRVTTRRDPSALLDSLGRGDPDDSAHFPSYTREPSDLLYGLLVNSKRASVRNLCLSPLKPTKATQINET